MCWILFLRHRYHAFFNLYRLTRLQSTHYTHVTVEFNHFDLYLTSESTKMNNKVTRHGLIKRNIVVESYASEFNIIKFCC